MDLDLSALLALFTGGSAQAAAIGAVVLWVVQRFASGKGFRPADLFTDLIAAFTKKTQPTTPVLPPVTPAGPNTPPANPDTESLLEIIANRVRDRLRLKVSEAGGDDHVAVNFYSRFVSALKETKVAGDGKPATADPTK